MVSKTQAMDRLIEQDADLIDVPAMTDVETIAERLTEAQRDTMLGHLVEISPDEAQALIDAGLKEKPFEQKEIVMRQVWPTTKKGLAVRDHLKGLPNDQ